MRPNGFNPLRHRCEADGCYNLKLRPKIEQFCECFPGKISFGDVDGIVEINGRFLLLEWKKEPRELPAGQRIMFSHLVALPERMFTVLCVAGDPETMNVTHSMRFKDNGSVWTPRDFHEVWTFCRAWSDWASKPRKGLAG